MQERKIGKPPVCELPSVPSGREGWPWIFDPVTFPRKMPGGGEWPTISVITPSFNQGQYIEETIRSVLLQGYPALQFIVVDGGSSDGALDVIKKYSDQISILISEPDEGQSHAINKGLQLITGEVVSWLNSDDVLMPGALKAVAEYWRENSNIAFLSGESEYREETGTKTIHQVSRVPHSPHEIFSYCRGLYFPQPSVFMSSKALRRAGFVDQSLHYAMDLDLWFRLSQVGKIGIICKKLSWMRQHDNAKTWRDEPKVLREVELVFRKHDKITSSSILRRALRDCRRRQAMCINNSGVLALKNGDLMSARDALRQAYKRHAPVIFKRCWIGLAIRAWLPTGIQKILLSRP